MDKFKNFIAHPLVQLIGFQGVVAAITWVVGKATAVPLFYLWVGILVAITCAFVGLNQSKSWKQSHKRNLRDLPDKEIEDIIRNWLDDARYSFQRKDDNTCKFNFVVTDEQKRPVTIVRAISKPSVLALSTAITLGDSHSAKHKSRSARQKERLASDLRIEMARYGIGYSGINESLERAVLSDVVPIDDSLTEFYLKQRIFFVTGAFALYSAVLDKWSASVESDSIKESPPPQ